MVFPYCFFTLTPSKMNLFIIIFSSRGEVPLLRGLDTPPQSRSPSSIFAPARAKSSTPPQTHGENCLLLCMSSFRSWVCGTPLSHTMTPFLLETKKKAILSKTFCLHPFFTFYTV